MGDVRFTNNYFTKIYVVYMWKDPGCESACGDPWNVAGWINLAPGETQTRQNPTNNRWFYYYAEADDGRFWSGNVTAGVGKGVFKKCRCQPNDPPFFHNVGMRELDLRESGGVNFIR